MEAQQNGELVNVPQGKPAIDLAVLLLSNVHVVGSECIQNAKLCRNDARNRWHRAGLSIFRGHPLLGAVRKLLAEVRLVLMELVCGKLGRVDLHKCPELGK